MNAETIKAAIRDVPDFPKPGILFKDITPVLSDPVLFRASIDIFANRHRDAGLNKVAAVDARGFFFAGALCDRLNVGLVPIRKQGKLPYETYEQTYDLEYGSATLAIHRDAFEPGDRVLLVDDLLATGGTARASAQLIKQAGGELVEINFLVELAFLKGREILGDYSVFAPIVF
ncbi:MAG: adenine phosphoribosyltransferase [Verrucomicrobia bacterium]|nr:adenine phosphoribosyltransferase [Verrucomicrobiota bacterium]